MSETYNVYSTPCDIIASIRVIPVATGTSIRKPVEMAIETYKDAGISCKPCATCTEISGASWNKLMTTTHLMIQRLLSEDDINRITCDIHLDCKRFSRSSVPPYREFLPSEEDQT